MRGCYCLSEVGDRTSGDAANVEAVEHLLYEEEVDLGAANIMELGLEKVWKYLSQSSWTKLYMLSDSCSVQYTKFGTKNSSLMGKKKCSHTKYSLRSLLSRRPLLSLAVQLTTPLDNAARVGNHKAHV